MLLKELRIVLSSNCDLVVATVPHCSHGTCQPKEWVIVMEWDGVRFVISTENGALFRFFLPNCFSLFNFFYIFASILRNTNNNSLILFI